MYRRHYRQISAMLTTGEVANLFKVHPSTVRRWNDKGLIKAYRIGPRGERRFIRKDIDSYAGGNPASTCVIPKISA